MQWVIVEWGGESFMYRVEVPLDSCHVSVRGGPVVFQLGFSVGACDVLVSIFVSGE